MPVNKILVVDDSSVDLLHLQNMLQQAGYTVYTATSGKEAVQKAESQKPDAILLDIVMQEMDGFEACRRLTKGDQTRDIPVVFVTSKSQKADRVWAQMQGAKALITKPYSQDVILRQLHALG